MIYLPSKLSLAVSDAAHPWEKIDVFSYWIEKSKSWKKVWDLTNGLGRRNISSLNLYQISYILSYIFYIILYISYVLLIYHPLPSNSIPELFQTINYNINGKYVGHKNFLYIIWGQFLLVWRHINIAIS